MEISLKQEGQKSVTDTLPILTDLPMQNMPPECFPSSSWAWHVYSG